MFLSCSLYFISFKFGLNPFNLEHCVYLITVFSYVKGSSQGCVMTVQGAHIPLREILKSGNRNKILHYEKNETLEKFIQRRGRISLDWRYLELALTGPWITLSRLSHLLLSAEGWKEYLQRVLVTETVTTF